MLDRTRCPDRTSIRRSSHSPAVASDPEAPAQNVAVPVTTIRLSPPIRTWPDPSAARRTNTRPSRPSFVPWAIMRLRVSRPSDAIHTAIAALSEPVIGSSLMPLDGDRLRTS